MHLMVGGNSANFNYLHKDWIGNARLTSNLSSHVMTHEQYSSSPTVTIFMRNHLRD